MGNHSETSTIVENQEFSLQHPRINNAVWKKTKGHEFFETTFPIESTKQYDDWKDNLKESPVANSQWALHPTKHEYKKAGMCGNSGTATARYDNYPFLLSQEIENKNNQEENKKFNDFQIWYLLYILTDMANQFHKKGEKLGDIRPKNVFINEEGKLKAATKHSWPRQVKSFEKFFFDKQKAYLSPQQMKQVQIGRAKSTSDPVLAETFSIGLTALDAVLLENSEHLYKNQTFDRSRLQGKRQNLKNEPGYSDLLKYIILSMTEPRPENRVRTSKLCDWFQHHKNKILALEPFAATDIPDKVKQTAERNPILQRSIQKSNATQNPIFIQQNPIVSSQGPIIRKVESGVPVYQTYPPEMVTPINNFTTQNSQVKQEPVIYNEQPKQQVIIQQKVRHSLNNINEKIANSKKMFPTS